MCRCDWWYSNHSSIDDGPAGTGIGYSKQAAVGTALGGILNIALDPLFMFVLLPKGYEILGACFPI